jgi:hypothetical protein
MTRNLLPVINTSPPATYGECINGTVMTGTLKERESGRVSCAALSCRHNLRRVSSENVPGRRNKGIAPEWTVDGESTASSPSCALDVANRGAHSCSDLAKMEGKSKRRLQQEVRAAVQSYREALVDDGVSEDEIDAVVSSMLAVLEQERRGR